MLMIYEHKLINILYHEKNVLSMIGSQILDTNGWETLV